MMTLNTLFYTKRLTPCFVSKFGIEEEKENLYPETKHSLKDQYSPLHIAADGGSFPLWMYISQKIGDINHKSSNGCTPYLIAVQKGHYETCENIIDNIEDKNPDDNPNKLTPLDVAADYGHSDICRLILKHLEVKNPRNCSSRPFGNLCEYNGRFG